MSTTPEMKAAREEFTRELSDFIRRTDPHSFETEIMVDEIQSGKCAPIIAGVLFSCIRTFSAVEVLTAAKGSRNPDARRIHTLARISTHAEKLVRLYAKALGLSGPITLESFDGLGRDQLLGVVELH